MSTTYKVQSGDTFEVIARRAYGDGTASGNIQRANPGVLEPLTAGTVVTVPRLPERVQDAPTTAPPTSANEVAVLIGGKRFRYWSTCSITRSLDTVDALTITAPFAHDTEGFKDMFRPLSFEEIRVTVGGEPLFTGVMVGVSPRVSKEGKILTVTAYSLPGVLADCTAPASLFPLEFSGLTLKEIAAKVCEPFGVRVELTGDPGAVFERVRLSPTGAVWPWLVKLCTQRGFVMSSTATGALRIYKPDTPTTPAAILQQGLSPLTQLSPMINAQTVYSHVTGITPARSGSKGAQYTVQAEGIGTMRPHTYNLPDTLDADAREAVAGKVRRMYSNAVRYSALVATWRTTSEELWKPGDLVSVDAPDAMIYKPYLLQVRSVVFQRDERQETASLELTLPDNHKGLPWD